MSGFIMANVSKGDISPSPNERDLAFGKMLVTLIE